jgi:hypothetical protein
VEIIPEDVLKAYAELYEALSDATLESFKSTATYLTETIGALSANAELYNAGVLIFALSDGEYDSIIIPGIDFSLVLPDNTLDVTADGEVIAQWMINNNISPRGGVDVVGFEGGYYAVLRQLNQ